MKNIVLTVVCLLAASPVSAQALKIHSHPQKSAYGDWTKEAPPIDFQVHWPGGGSQTNCPSGSTLTPGLGHQHIQVQAPWWAELTANDTITLPIVLKLFCTAGHFIDAGAQYAGDWGYKDIRNAQGGSALAVQAPFWPFDIPGDPNGLVQIPASLTFNFKDGLDVGIPQHGWGRINITMAVKTPDGCIVHDTAILSFYSMIDPTAPETPMGEAGINLAVRGGVTECISTYAFQAQLTEFKSMLPILAPISVPQITDVFAYNYGDTSRFPIAFYQMLIDPDFHMGVPGTLVTTTQILGTTGNLDTWLPATIAKSTPPMGLGQNVHRLGFSWALDTGDGFVLPDHGPIPAHNRLVTLITFPVTIGATPSDDLSKAVNWAPIAVSPPPIPTPPPPPISPWKTLFVDPNPPTKWLGQCLDTTHTLCWPTNMLAVCAGPDPKNCAWTPVVVP